MSEEQSDRRAACELLAQLSQETPSELRMALTRLSRPDPRCEECNQPLDDLESRALGFGPVCRARGTSAASRRAARAAAALVEKHIREPLELDPLEDPIVYGDAIQKARVAAKQAAMRAIRGARKMSRAAERSIGPDSPEAKWMKSRTPPGTKGHFE